MHPIPTRGRAQALVPLARLKALELHKGQPYGERVSEDDYLIKHLDPVAALVAQYGPLHVVVAYLHDTLEDTPYTTLELVRDFGDDVAFNVMQITDPAGGRALAKREVNQRLAVLPPTAPCLVVKVADRLANVRASRQEGRKDLLERYRSEHTEFWKAAYRPHLCDFFWDRLHAELGVNPS